MRRIAALVGSALVAGMAGLLLAAPAFAQDPVSVDRNGSFVDTTDRFDSDEEATIEAALSRIQERAGVDVAVLVDGGDGRDVRTVAEEVVDAWEVGGASQRGVLLYVATGSRGVRIEVGPTLQSRLSPSEAEQILDDDILPRFRDDRVVAGVAAGIVAIGDQLEVGDLGLDGIAGRGTSGLSDGQVTGLFVGGIALGSVGLIALLKRLGRGGGGRSGGGWASSGSSSSYSSYDSSSSSSDYSSSSDSSSSDSGGASGSW